MPMDPVEPPGPATCLGIATKTITGDYTVSAADRGRTLLCSPGGAGFTVTLPAQASVGSGFHVAVVKTPSAFTVTLAAAGGSLLMPSGAYSIGVASRAVPDGMSLIVMTASDQFWRQIAGSLPAAVATAVGTFTNATVGVDAYGRVTVAASGTAISYSAGTWTPTLYGSTVAGANTYDGTTAGTWTKIGNRCMFSCRVALTSKDAGMAGEIRISGLPSSTIANVSSPCSVLLGAGTTYAGDGPGAYVFASNNFISLCSMSSGGGFPALGPADIDAASIIQVSGSYPF